MKGHVIATGTHDGRPAAAYVADGKLHDFLAAPPPEYPAPGTVFRGKVGRPVKGLGGFFVDLPNGRRGFLRQTKGISAGGPIYVQVTGYAVEGKAIPVTHRINFRGRYCVVTPEAPGRNLSKSIDDAKAAQTLEQIAGSLALPETTGLIMRSAAQFAPPETVQAEAEKLAEKARAIASGAETIEGPDPVQSLASLWPEVETIDEGHDSFDRFGVDDALSDILAPDIALGTAGTVCIEPTRALVAIDVNTGTDTSPAAGLKTSLLAARSLPRFLRIKGLGGQIVVDFAPFPKKDRRTMENTLRNAFRGDPISTTLAGWTPLGHFELQRRHERLPVERVER